MSNHIEVVLGMIAELEAKTTTAFIVTEHPVVTQWRAELAALRALLVDAERMDFLRNDPPATLCVRAGGMYIDGPCLNAAIDAATKESGNVQR
jgi:hypothetical protein